MDAAGENLKIIANYAVGYNNIDIKAAKERDIMVTNTPGVLTDTVADHTVALIFAIARKIVRADQYTRAGKYKAWGPKLFLGAEVTGETLGIIGFGRIGSAVAMRMAQGFDMKILYYDVYRNQKLEKKYGFVYRELDDLLEEADFISLHTALTEETRHLINAERLKLMKSNARLINTSRGPIVDEKALIKALKVKKIAGAALDVFEDEPKLAPGLVDLHNIILTPHIASATKGTRDKMAEIAASNVIAFLGGKKPLNPVE